MKNLKVGYKLVFLTLLLITGQIIFGVLSYFTINSIKINGALYDKIILGKDVVADILPPPEYIIETHLTVLQILDTTDQAAISQYKEKLVTLKQELVQYHDDLQLKMPEGGLKSVLLTDAYSKAMDYYKAVESDFLPAIDQGDITKAQKILKDQLEPLYQSHRGFIDEAVKLADDQNLANEKLASKTIAQNTIGLLGILAVMICLAFIICGFIIKGIIGPLKFLTKQLKLMSEGAFHNRIPDMYLTGRDELGDIAKATDQMQDSFVVVLGDIKELSEQIALMAEELKSASDSGGDISGQIATATNHIALGSQNQKKDIEQIRKEMKDAVCCIGSGFDKASLLKERSERTFETASAGSGYITHVIEQFQGIGDTVAYATKSIGRFGRRSEEIQGFADTITGIATRTSMLALNASIEAARAGESGKGFAVVAKEIGDLSISTAKATRQIAELIQDIQNETMETVVEMEENLQKVNTQMDEAELGKKALMDVVERVEVNRLDSASIYDLYAQIQTKTDVILQTTDRMAATLNESAVFSEGVAESSKEQYQNVSSIMDHANALARVSDRLKEHVNKFIV